METIWKVFSSLVALFLQLCNGLPLDLEHTYTDGHTQFLTGLIAVLLTICGVVCLAGCLCCQRRNGFKEFRDSPVVASLASNLDHGHVNPIANGEFTIFTPLSPPHQNNNVFVANQQVITRAEDDFKSGEIDVSSWFDANEKDFPRTKLKYIRELGKGWFGRVVEGTAQGLYTDDSEWTPVVVRILEASASSKQRVLFLHDAAIYRCPPHHNLLKLHGRSLDTVPLLLLQEYCSQGDIKTYLKQQVAGKDKFLNSDLPLLWCYQLASALKHLHDSDITHADLATRNCQLALDLSLKLGDYGSAVSDFPEDYYHGPVNVPVRWCAPECVTCTVTTIQPKKITKEGNIWSLGVCLWEIYECGSQPYSELGDDEVVSQVLGPTNVRLAKPTFSVLYTDYIYRLMQLCWVTSESRPSISQIDLMLADLMQVQQHTKHSKEKDAPVSIQDFDRRWENLKPNTIVKTDVIDILEPENDLGNITILNMDLNTDEPKSPSLNNLAGSLDNLLEKGDGDKWLENVAEQENLSFVQGLSEAMRDLDNTIAMENVSSLETSPKPKLQFKLGPTRMNKKERNLVQNDSITDSMLFAQRTSSESETEDEHWKKKIERGDYSEKVRQKSRSVADLMILTHIDYSESDSETPSLDCRTNYFKNVRCTPTNNLENVSTTFGSEGNLLSIHNTFEEQLKKLQEERRDSLLFVPDFESQKLINESTSADDMISKSLIDDLNSPATLEPKNQIFNVYNVVTISPKYSPVHTTNLNHIINYNEDIVDEIKEKNVIYEHFDLPKREIPKLSEIIENNNDLMDYIIAKYDPDMCDAVNVENNDVKLIKNFEDSSNHVLNDSNINKTVDNVVVNEQCNENAHITVNNINIKSPETNENSVSVNAAVDRKNEMNQAPNNEDTAYIKQNHKTVQENNYHDNKRDIFELSSRCKTNKIEDSILLDDMFVKKINELSNNHTHNDEMEEINEISNNHTHNEEMEEINEISNNHTHNEEWKKQNDSAPNMVQDKTIESQKTNGSIEEESSENKLSETNVTEVLLNECSEIIQDKSSQEIIVKTQDFINNEIITYEDSNKPHVEFDISNDQDEINPSSLTHSLFTSTPFVKRSLQDNSVILGASDDFSIDFYSGLKTDDNQTNDEVLKFSSNFILGENHPKAIQKLFDGYNDESDSTVDKHVITNSCNENIINELPKSSDELQNSTNELQNSTNELQNGTNELKNNKSVPTNEIIAQRNNVIDPKQDNKSEKVDLNYSLETWDNFLGQSFDEQHEFDHFSVEPQNLFIEAQNVANKTQVVDQANSTFKITTVVTENYSPENEKDEDLNATNIVNKVEDINRTFVNANATFIANEANNTFVMNDGVDNGTFNVDDGLPIALNGTFEVVNGTFAKDAMINKTVDLNDINLEMEADEKCDTTYNKEGYVNEGCWENEGGSGWFLHPQTNGDDPSGQMDLSQDDSYVGFSMDDEIMAAIRNELLTKLPQAQRASSEQVEEGDEYETTDKNEVFIRYNIYNPPLSPIPEESESLSELLNSGQSTPHCTINTDLGDSDSDWSEPGMGPNSLIDDDTLSPRLMESPLKSTTHYRHTPSQDSCCSNDTLFNLEEIINCEKNEDTLKIDEHLNKTITLNNTFVKPEDKAPELVNIADKVLINSDQISANITDDSETVNIDNVIPSVMSHNDNNIDVVMNENNEYTSLPSSVDSITVIRNPDDKILSNNDTQPLPDLLENIPKTETSRIEEFIEKEKSASMAPKIIIQSVASKKELEESSSSSETYLTASDTLCFTLQNVAPLNSPEDRAWKHIEASLSKCNEIPENYKVIETADVVQVVYGFVNENSDKENMQENQCSELTPLGVSCNNSSEDTDKNDSLILGVSDSKEELIYDEIKDISATNELNNISEISEPKYVNSGIKKRLDFGVDNLYENIDNVKSSNPDINVYQNIPNNENKYVNVGVVNDQNVNCNVSSNLYENINEEKYENIDAIKSFEEPNKIQNTYENVRGNSKNIVNTYDMVCENNDVTYENISPEQYENIDALNDKLYETINTDGKYVNIAEMNLKNTLDSSNQSHVYDEVEAEMENTTKNVDYVELMPEYSNINYDNINYAEYIDLVNNETEVEYDNVNDNSRGSVEEVYGPLTDIRFSGPSDSQMMTTSFSDSNDLGDDQDWDSGSDTRSSSSGEFIWKEGEHEASVKALHAAAHDLVHSQEIRPMNEILEEDTTSSSEDGDGPEFVPSAWDKFATPTKSALRSPEKSLDRSNSKSRGVSFKKEKYHCIYEYPREPETPAAIPTYDMWKPEHDYATLTDWELDTDPFLPGTSETEINDSTSSAPHNHSNRQHRNNLYQITNVPDFGSTILDDDFYISSSAKPFDSFGGASSQFFPGKHCDWSDLIKNNENITPDSGVEDITPGSLSDSDYIRPSRQILSLKILAQVAANKNTQMKHTEIGGLRHTLNKLKLDLPPSPSAFTNLKTFNVEVDPIICRHAPTFTTFGKSRFSVQQVDTSDDKQDARNVSFEALPYNPMAKHVFKDDFNLDKDKNRVEVVRGEASLLDSADEDSGIESCTLERKQVSTEVFE